MPKTPEGMPGQLVARLVTAYLDIATPLGYVALFEKEDIRKLRDWFAAPVSYHTRASISKEAHKQALANLDCLIEGFATLQDLNIHLNGFLPKLEPNTRAMRIGTDTLEDQRERLRHLCLEHPNKIILIIVRCKNCGVDHEMQIPTNGLAAWLSGALIQNALPDLDDGERELLRSNLCESCFDELHNDL